MTSRAFEHLRSVDGRRVSLEETLKAVAIPPVAYDKVPRVEHFIAGFTGPVNRVVSQALELPEAFVDELIRFGAVYSCPVIPDTAPSTASSEELAQIRDESVRRVGKHPGLRQPRRVSAQDVVHRYAYCRVHVHPKRFPAYYRHDWSQRVVYENAHCVVVNKPPGCQVPPRVDNVLECLTRWIQDLLELEMELKPVHRLDTGTEGLVVLAKTTEFARYFQRLLNSGGVEKRYRALTLEKPQNKTLRHWIEANHHTRGCPRRSLISETPSRRGAYAELEIVKTRKMRLSEEAQRHWSVTEAFESTIDLKTGRTHQIRVQLAFEGFPLLGDGLYGSLSTQEAESFGSEDGCLGLQATSLRFNDSCLHVYFEDAESGTLSLNAGDPWWRSS